MRYLEDGPMGYYFDEVEVGQVFVSRGRTITEADIVQFGTLTGDLNPMHADAEYMLLMPTPSALARVNLRHYCIYTGGGGNQYTAGWKIVNVRKSRLVHDEPVQRKKTSADPFRLRLTTRNTLTVNWRHANAAPTCRSARSAWVLPVC